MGNETGIVTIGNMEFNGVKVLKSEVKKTESGENLNCVWTDAGYFEYKDQPLEIGYGTSKPVAKVIASRQYGPSKLELFPSLDDDSKKGVYLGKTLTLHNVTDGKFIPQGDEFVTHNSRLNPENKDISGIGIFSSAGDGRDYSTFTVDLRNGREDHVYKQFSDAKVLMDEYDTMTEKKVSDVKKGSLYEHILNENKKIKYDR